ncbi:hypothetical protein, partial [Amycolatopsis sp. NPDC003676]
MSFHETEEQKALRAAVAALASKYTAARARARSTKSSPITCLRVASPSVNAVVWLWLSIAIVTPFLFVVSGRRVAWSAHGVSERDR